MPLGQRIKRLPGNKLLRHLPLNSMLETLSGDGFLPSKAERTLSIHSLQPVRLRGALCSAKAHVRFVPIDGVIGRAIFVDS